MLIKVLLNMEFICKYGIRDLPKNICKSASDSQYWMTMCKCYMKAILLTWHVYKRFGGVGGSDAVHSTGLYIKLVQCTAS